MSNHSFYTQNRKEHIMKNIILISLLALSMTACATAQQERAATGGALIGAAAGAAIGANSGRALEGAVIGGVIGAAAGAALEDNRRQPTPQAQTTRPRPDYRNYKKKQQKNHDGDYRDKQENHGHYNKRDDDHEEE